MYNCGDCTWVRKELGRTRGFEATSNVCSYCLTEIKFGTVLHTLDGQIFRGSHAFNIVGEGPHHPKFGKVYLCQTLWFTCDTLHDTRLEKEKYCVDPSGPQSCGLPVPPHDGTPTTLIPVDLEQSNLA